MKRAKLKAVATVHAPLPVAMPVFDVPPASGAAGPPGEEIRPMTADDLVSVHALERSAQQNPWSLAQFAQELDNPVARIDLCLRNGELAGFLCSWWIAGELQIQNVATAPAFRRQGVAARLLGAVMGRALGAGLEAAWLEVRTGNAAAIALYERFGFRAAGVRPRYYADGEDALMMCYRPEAG